VLGLAAESTSHAGGLLAPVTGDPDNSYVIHKFQGAGEYQCQRSRRWPLEERLA